MTLLLSALITGLGIGSVYGLIVVGYTIIYNSTGVFNLAQGDLVMVGIMVSFVMLNKLHVPQIAAFATVIVVVVALALVEERTVVRRFLRLRAPGLTWFISTLAFSLAIEATVYILYGNRPIEAIASFLPTAGIPFGSVRISPQLLLSLAALIGVILLLDPFYTRTWIGPSNASNCARSRCGGLARHFARSHEHGCFRDRWSGSWHSGLCRRAHHLL